MSNQTLSNQDPPEQLQAKEASSATLCSHLLDSVICGDNCEVMRGLPDECIDLVVTSPPYDDLRTYGGHEWDFEKVAEQLTRCLKQGGVIVWVVADRTVKGSETGSSMRQALHFVDTCGLRLHDTMIYRKANYMPLTHNRYEQAWEYMFVFSKGRPTTWNPIKVPIKYPRNRPLTMRNGDSRDKVSHQKSGTHRIKENVWTYKCGGGHIDTDGRSHEHPAPFSEYLVKDHIESWSNANDIVLDPFAGSGNTLRVAKALNRRYIGIEVNHEYVKICEERTMQESLPLYCENA